MKEKSPIDDLLQKIRDTSNDQKDYPTNPNEVNNFLNEFAEEHNFDKFREKDLVFSCVKLWEIIEDIEKAEKVIVDDQIALRTIIKELTSKRFLYANPIVVKELSDQCD
jgi:hypothetical protein